MSGRGVAIANGRGGVALSGRGSTCPETCCDTTCAFVYRAESCAPVLPPVEGCGFTRPPDIFICTDTICTGDGEPVMPGDTIIVNGQCYGVVGPQLPRSDVGGGFLYDLPDVECVTDCSAPGCTPESPFSLAEPCNPGCPAIWFCRSQFASCRVIRVRFGGVDPPSGPGCCYRFDPTLPPATPPSLAVVCVPSIVQGGANVGIDCRVLDFGGMNTATLGTTDCCECGDRGDLVPGDCNHFEIVAGGGIVGGVPMCDPPTLTEVCCPEPTPATRILVDYSVRITNPPGSFNGGPTGFGNWTTATGVLAPDGGSGCGAGDEHFSGEITVTSVSGPLLNGVPDGVPFVTTYLGSACFCPLRVEQIQLPPGDCQDQDPETTCECLESFYDGFTIRNRWRMTLVSDSGGGPQVQQVNDVEVNIRVVNPGVVPFGCEGGCNGRTARADGSDNGGIRIRGGGSRALPFGVRGLIDVEEWL